MFEYGNGSSAYYISTSSTPKVKKITVTVYEYDENGNITKETCTETEYTEGYTYQPAPYQTHWTSSISSDPGSTATN